MRSLIDCTDHLERPHLYKALAEVVRQKGRLLREFGAQWFVEVL